MPLSHDSNQISLPGGATNSENNPHISIWPLDLYWIWHKVFILKHAFINWFLPTKKMFALSKFVFILVAALSLGQRQNTAILPALT